MAAMLYITVALLLPFAPEIAGQERQTAHPWPGGVPSGQPAGGPPTGQVPGSQPAAQTQLAANGASPTDAHAWSGTQSGQPAPQAATGNQGNKAGPQSQPSGQGSPAVSSNIETTTVTTSPKSPAVKVTSIAAKDDEREKEGQPASRGNQSANGKTASTHITKLPPGPQLAQPQSSCICP
ncbi:hypothetical protein HDE_06467 [Halotydeus destructor]|nr:hypothetical protein HDE_06467 [Halotydeus destructor]